MITLGVTSGIACYKAVGQLIRPSKRHFWELTEHGLVDHDEPTFETVKGPVHAT